MIITQSLWQLIKKVADYDKELITIDRNLTTIKEGMEKDQQQLASSNALITEKQKNLFILQKDYQLKDLEAQDLKAAEDKKRVQLDHVNDQKEYKAFEKEIATIAQKRSVLEEQILKQMYSLDTLKKEIETLASSQGAQIEKIKCDISAKNDNINHLAQKRAEIFTSREDAMQRIPDEWKTQYERMRHSVQDPIVPINNTSCSACFYNIPLPDIAKLKKSQLILCRNCFRFLYCDEDQTKEPSTTQY